MAKTKYSPVRAIALVAVVAVTVDYCTAFCYPDGLGLLQGYYAVPAPLPPPPPVALPPPVVYPPCAPVEPPKPCGCECHHPSCLSLLKPCIHAKLLNLKKKLIEKKLQHLLMHCMHFNKHLCCDKC